MDGSSVTSVLVGRNIVSALRNPAESREGPGTSGRQRGGKPKRRRRFPPDYKLRALKLASEALESGRGGLSRFLKREGLRSSHLAQWRKQREQGLLGKARRGRPGRSRESLLHENGRLKRRLAYLEECLRGDLRRTDPTALALFFRG